MKAPLKKVKTAAIALNQTPLAWDHNRDNILKAIQAARKAKVDLICFPELCLSGYGCEDAFLSPATARMALKILTEILPETDELAIAVGLPLWHEGHLYNVVCFIHDTQIQGFAVKQNLARDGVHYEPRWFTPWIADQVQTVQLEGHSKTYPIGDLIFDWRNIRLGFEICEDAWVAKRVAFSLARRGVDLILNPSASHFAFGKTDIRQNFVMRAASDLGIGYIYANLLGNEAGRIIYDGDTLIAAADALLASGPRFSFQDYVLTTASIDVTALRDYRSHLTLFSNNLNGSDNENNPVKKEIQKSAGYQNSRLNRNLYQEAKILFQEGPTWEKSPHRKEEEFIRSIALALFDYLRKSRAQGFVLNLSGGADSAACACLVYYMVELGVESLGSKIFQEKLNFNPNIAELSPEENGFSKKVMRHILFCLFQGTVNNATASKSVAEELSKTLSASFAAIEIDTLVEMYSRSIEGILHRNLTWKQDDMALQNIQARVRSPGIWLLANLRQAIVLCTSNRSEAAVGYTTMDGDTAGGICPIAGIDKYYLLNWLKWLANIGPIGLSPLPVLKKILALKPSAELRPLTENQSDEEDLMSFEWLASIEHLFVHDRLSAPDILTRLVKKFPTENPENLASAVERFLKLWSHSQWKRERLAPSFHVDDENVDPKTWCRFPILSGGYQRELAEMWKMVKSSYK